MEGKGEADWPLYREEEAKTTITSGGIVFAGGGEQVVETLRINGFTATTCQGGESNFPTIASRLAPAFAEALEYELKPLLVIWPDNDKPGIRAGEALLKECWKNKIPAVVFEPSKLWLAAEKDDALEFFEWAHRQGMDIEAIRRQLENAIDDAIDDAIEESRLRWQREQWKAPISHQGEMGFWREDREGNRWFEPACNFDFVVTRELQSSKGSALMIRIKRSFEAGEKQIALPWSETFRPYDFLKALNRLGSGVVCKLSAPNLASLLHTRLHEYRTNRNGRVFKQIDRYGQQPDGVWVFRDRQYTPQGELTSEDETGWVFADVSSEGDEIPCPVLAHENPDALSKLVEASRRFFGDDNIHQVLLTMGWVTAGLHSRAIFAREHAFPLLNGHGEPGSCKTLAAETALSLVGSNWPQMGMLARVSVSAIYEQGSRTGSLPFIWDDPERDRSNEELLKSWFNWKARVVRGNKQQPHSPLGVTSNHVFGSDQAAAYTRFVRIPFERATGRDNGAFQELQAAQREASGAFPQLLSLGYPTAAIAQLEGELLNHLPKAHARIAKSLAIVSYYAQKIVELAGGGEDIKQWVIERLCPAEDDGDSAGNSLQDFADKISALEAQSLVGEWNKRQVRKRDGSEWIALHYVDVWALVDKHYSPTTYNQKSLKSLLQKAGGKTDETQSFVKSRDAQLAYERFLINAKEDNTPTAPELATRRAWLLPLNLFGHGNDNDSPTPDPQPTPNHIEITSNHVKSQKNVISQNADSVTVSALSGEPNHTSTKNSSDKEEVTAEGKIESAPAPLSESADSSVISVIPLPVKVSEITEGQQICDSGDRSAGENVMDAAQHEDVAQPEEEPTEQMIEAAANYFLACFQQPEEEGREALRHIRGIYSRKILHEGARLLQQRGHGDAYSTIVRWVVEEPANSQKEEEEGGDSADADDDFPKVGDRLWRKPVPAKRGKSFEPGIELVVTSLTPNGAFADSTEGDRYHISWHAWESGTFIPYQP